MASPRRTPRSSRIRKAPRTAYTLIASGPDGRPRVETFDGAEDYRARLRTLRDSADGAVSIDEIVELLDV